MFRTLPFLLAIFLLSTILGVHHLIVKKNISLEKSQISPQSFFIKNIPEEEPEEEILSCEDINWEEGGAEADAEEKEIINEYLEMALLEDGRYSPGIAIDAFIDVMNAEFYERVLEFVGGNYGCDLSKVDVSSPVDDHKIELPSDFLKRQWEEYRKIDCALFAMSKDQSLLCEPSVGERTTHLICDKNFRTQEIQKTRRNLGLSLEVVITQLNEILNAWPIHKRLECLNVEISDQRTLLLAFLDEFSKLPKAFINASQSR